MKNQTLVTIVVNLIIVIDPKYKQGKHIGINVQSLSREHLPLNIASSSIVFQLATHNSTLKKLALYHTMCHSRNKLYLKHPINFA
jgi:hypothetical protein